MSVLNGQGNGSPLRYSCLENLMERGAWWAAVHGGCKELDRTEQMTYTTNKEGNSTGTAQLGSNETNT